MSSVQIKFHELVRDGRPFKWDFPKEVLEAFTHRMWRHAACFPDDATRRLCYDLLYSDVLVIDGRPTFQRFDPADADPTFWYSFMRGLTFIGAAPPDIRRHLGEGQTANLFGALTSSGRDWESQYYLAQYQVENTRLDPGHDPRLTSKQRYYIRREQVLDVIAVGRNNAIELIDMKLPAIVEGWACQHGHSYGVRNGFTQLCLWTWLQANIQCGQALLFQCETEDLKGYSLAGYVNSIHGWTFQTFWQPLPIKHPLGIATLRATLPLLPIGATVWLTCPSVTGDVNDSRYEIYKRKFAITEQLTYSEFLAPFDAQAPYYHTGRKETVR